MQSKATPICAKRDRQRVITCPGLSGTEVGGGGLRVAGGGFNFKECLIAQLSNILTISPPSLSRRLLNGFQLGLNTSLGSRGTFFWAEGSLPHKEFTMC